MPDNYPSRWSEFADWVYSTYGWSERVGIVQDTSLENPIYQWWLANGTPSGKGQMIYGFGGEGAPELPKEPWEDTPEGPYYVDEYPGEPHILGPGFHWGKREYDEAGKPVRPEWVIKPDVEEDEEAGTRTEYIIKGNALFERTFNTETGELTGETFVGWQPQRDTGEITPWRKAQLGEREQTRTLQVQQAELDRLERERQWQAEHAGPEDWIERWKYMHGQAPAPSEEAIATARAGVTEATSRLQQVQAQYPVNPQQPPPQLNPSEVAYRQQLQGARQTQAGLWGQPQGPPAPSWLPQFVPSQTAGQPITKARTRTPSMQQWERTPWSTRQGLRGYTEWAGYRPYQDILEQMAMMVPEKPTGAGYKRWQPARQRS